MIDLAHSDGWKLEVVPWASYTHNNPTAPWWSVILTPEEGGTRYWLGWNGRRFARSEPLHRATVKHPKQVMWAFSVLIDKLPKVYS